MCSDQAVRVRSKADDERQQEVFANNFFEEICRALLESLDFFREVGHLGSLRTTVKALERDYSEGRPHVAQAIRSAKEWMVEAEAFEEEHGEGSLFKPGHPLCVELRATVPVRLMTGPRSLTGA